MLNIYDCARQELSIVSKEHQDIFRLFIPYYVANDFTQQMLSTYALQYPSSYIHYVSAPPEQLAKELRYGTTDAVVTVKADVPQLEHYCFRPLYKEAFIVVSSKDHPWVGKETVSMEELRDVSFLCTENNAYASYWDTLTAVCRRYGFEPKFSRKFLRQESMLMAIDVSNDVAVMAAHWVCIIPPHLVWTPISDDDAFSQLYLIYDKNKEDNTIIKEILSMGPCLSCKFDKD